MKLKNPFPVYGYFGPAYFCDRVQETQKILEAVDNGRNVTLIAPRRLGKTGLIHHVLNQLSKRGDVCCIYLDIFAVKTLPEFVQTFARAVFSGVETRFEKATKAAGRFLSACRPTISIDSLTGSPTLSFSFERSAAENTLREVFDYLKTKEQQIVIAIDEFQQVAEFPEKGTEALLRSYIQFLPNVRFIFSGSRQHLMAEMFLSANRPFFKSTQNLSIKALACDTYYEFASNFFSAAGRSLDRKAFAFAYQLVDGVTWEMQAILNRLWSRGISVADDEPVREVVTTILEENAADYANILANLSVNEVKLLRAVAQARCVAEPTSGAFLGVAGLSPSSMSLTLQHLVNRQLLYRSDQGIIVYDRFLGLWLQSSANLMSRFRSST